MKTLIYFLAFFFITYQLSAADGSFKQNVRGTVVDKDSKMPLVGASVVLIGSNPLIGTSTDVDGNFKLTEITPGRIGVQVSFVGYSPVTLTNLILSSAKELVLYVELEEMALTAKEVVVTANSEKDVANNKMASISARLFTIEETERYAGSRGDPARMAMNFAGVSGANDARNDIVIRGNSPTGVLYKLDDVEIPNPNHFAAMGTTGGPVNMLNNNTLRNSDFLTGAFPAEYGNVLSGVFDLKLRNGNNEKREHLFQVGFNGFEVGAEGPFVKGSKASYLINYRYSTLDLVYKMGMNVGTSGVPKYQDCSFKFNFPLKNGVISLFGLGGTSSIAMLDSKKDEADLYSSSKMDLYNGSDMGTTALSYVRNLSTNTYLKLVVSGLYENPHTHIDTLDANNKPHDFFNENSKSFRLTAMAILNTKLNAQISTRTGVEADRMGFDLNVKVFDKEIGDFRKMGGYKKSLADGNTLYRVYNQWQIKLGDKVVVNPGVYGQYFDLNSTYAVEPRVGLSYKVSEKQKLNMGYGLHSRMQPFYYYFYESRLADGSYSLTNHDLDFSKAHHYILGYDLSITQKLRFKAEAYYQNLYNIPVENSSSSFSTINNGAGWGNDIRDSMVNKGTGKNFGIEFTLERFFYNNFYYLITASVYKSNYKGSDGIERSTVFNGNYVANALVGKEFAIGENKYLVVDIKATLAGGKRYTPINADETRAKGSAFETVYYEDQAYSKQFSPYFKADVKIGFKMDQKHVTQEWQLYVENVTNQKNVFMQSYDRNKNEITNTYQLGLFPMMQYKLYF